MDAAALERVYEAFRDFHDYFAPALGRKQSRELSRDCLPGLLAQSEERRNAENLSEAVASSPRSLQRFLTESPWDDDLVMGRLQEYLGPRWGDPAGVWALDGSDFPKPGVKSVGVSRQCCGALGKIANCPAGRFVAHVGPKGRALVDRRLYLPREWTGGPERCAAAGAPADCRERRSQTELALEMLAGAQARGQLAAQWLAGDSACGMSPPLREGLAAMGMRYVRDARPDMTVWPLEPTWTDPPYQGNGRPRKPRLRGGQRQTMAERAAAIPEDGGREITIAQGSQGPRAYRYSAQRVRVTHRRQPGEVLGARSSGRSIARTGMAAASPAITSPTLPRTRRWKPWPAWAAPAGASQPSSRPRKAPLGGTSAKSAPGRAGIIASHHITSPCACWPGLFR